MPILFSLVAHGSTVLAENAQYAGNYNEVTEQMLSKITDDHPKRLTYSHGAFRFHKDRDRDITFLCITDDIFDRARAFAYLSEIKLQFRASYGWSEKALSHSSNNDFSTVLASQMKYFSESRDVDKIARVQGEIDDLKEVMIQNIDLVATRGEKLELLVNNINNLNSASVAFKKSSRNLSRSAYLKNVKIILSITFVILIVVYILVSIFCGGLSWPKCV